MEPDHSILEVDNVSCVRGDRRLFSEMSFTVTPGKCVQLTGPNGSGKTSLLRIICGLMEPEKGEIRWQGENIRALGEDYFASIAYVGHRNGVKEELTSVENLTISTGLTGNEVSVNDARKVLEIVGLRGRENLAARLLSEGQRRRLALARLLTCKKDIWVLDEAFTSLDKAAVRLMENLIQEQLDEGGMAIVATHQEISINAPSFQRIDLAS